MLLTDITHPLPMVKDYIQFAKERELPLESREIKLEHLLQWVYNLTKSNKVPDIYNNKSFHKGYYFLLRHMSPRMSLFIRKGFLVKIFSCKRFKVTLLVDLLELFFKASQEFATNHKGRDLIKTIPEILPEDKSSFDGIVSKIYDCFRISEAIEFYCWLVKCHPSATISELNSETLMAHIQRYRDFLKKAIPNRNSFKTKEAFLRPILRYLQKLDNEQKQQTDVINTTISIYNKLNHQQRELPSDPLIKASIDKRFLPENISILDDNKPCTISEVATLLNVDKATINNLCRKGFIISYQLSGKNGKRIIFVKHLKSFMISSISNSQI